MRIVLLVLGDSDPTENSSSMTNWGSGILSLAEQFCHNFEQLNGLKIASFFMSSFTASLSGSDKRYRFTIAHDASVLAACKIVKAEFDIKGDLSASIYGSPLNGELKLRDVARPEDVLTFSSADGGEIVFSTPAASLEDIPEGHFRVFTSLSIKSMTQGDVVAINEDGDLSSVSRELEAFIGRSLSGLAPAEARMKVFLPGGCVFEQHDGLTLRRFSECFPQLRRHL